MGCEFRLQPFKPPAERTIHGQWEFLIMEAARIHDEECHYAHHAGGRGGKSSPAAPASAAPGKEFHAVGENLVDMVIRDGKWHPMDGSKKAS